MSNKTGIYVTTNASLARDAVKLYADLKSMNETERLNLIFSNSFERNEESNADLVETLKESLDEKLSKCKSVLIIIKEEQIKDISLLNWELYTAVRKYNLPIILSYSFFPQELGTMNLYRAYWAKALHELINNKEIKSVHIAFNKKIIYECLRKYSLDVMPEYVITSK